MEKKSKKLVVKTIMLFMLIVRKMFIIPQGSCRFIPSCTQYAEQALEAFPLYKAIILILKRVLRCHPFSKGGFDPVIIENNKGVMSE